MKLRLTFFYITIITCTKALGENYEAEKRYSKAKFNVCRQMMYYSSGAINRDECWYNPDVDSFAHDVIKRYGYSFETHKVISNDNYITTVFRIPTGKTGDPSNKNKDRQPVFLLHGIASSSHSMLDIGKQSLAFALADAGYDVWLGNMRGSTYSLGHTNMTYMHPNYWKFSFHEIGKYDMPATLELIADQTQGKKILFIGHSLAASVFFVFESYHRNLSKQYLEGAVLIAPIVYLTNIESPLEEMSRFGNPIMILATLLGIKDNSTEVLQVIQYSRTLCKELPAIIEPCSNGIFLGFGLRSPNIPPHHIPLLISHNPSGFSVNTFNHLAQIVRYDGSFREYDHGVANNRAIYGDVFPPEYNVEGCETPVYVFHGKGDWISTEKDIEQLLSTIPEDKFKGSYKMTANVWKHFDYFYGKNLPTLFYKALLKSFKQFKNKEVEDECDLSTRKHCAAVICNARKSPENSATNDATVPPTESSTRASTTGVFTTDSSPTIQTKAYRRTEPPTTPIVKFSPTVPIPKSTTSEVEITYSLSTLFPNPARVRRKDDM